jgi:uncharacterized protein YecE (DUF72 family)
MNTYIGTSGWSYPHWKGIFYPAHTANRNFLSYYVREFNTVEVNNTFYGLPSEKTIHTWRETAPEGFVFSVKASKSITHLQRLRDPRPALDTLLDRIRDLGSALGPILFQLPPDFPADPALLNAFLTQLPAGHRYTIEFRDPDWFRPPVLSALEQAGVAVCVYDFNRRQSPRLVTADFVYVRLHGPEGPYAGQYSQAALESWAGFLSASLGQGLDIYCYFDNTQANYAPEDARRLKSLLSSC